MQSDQIRKTFLDFFSQKDHLVLPSFSLIPQNDPTLLLIGAGMAPLKPYFTGDKKPPYPRVATCQKCVRTPDIERVGETGRHATFFEMLGNFSFGDYFKEEAIAWAWELVTQGFGFSQDRLWVSIYEEDEEAYNIWRNNIGVSKDRIIRLGKEDNFWEIGVGPCGPCSEIYYDLGPQAGCGNSSCQVGCDCDRYLEIWNLVFTQFNRTPSGTLEPLERKNIDTGAGLERLAMALQGVQTIYQIDTVAPILDYILLQAANSGVKPEKDNISLRIVTEHIRGITFLVADGVLPSNEGRGYVLRRLLRRALRHGRLLGIEESFLYEAASQVISMMGNAYPELKQREEYITQIIKIEEDRFQDTLKQGIQILEEKLETLIKQGVESFPGDIAFRLYDTYGFPLDLTKEILFENDMQVNEEEFQRFLEEQREMARRTVKSTFDYSHDAWKFTSEIETDFVGYDIIETETQVKGILVEGSPQEEIKKGQTAEILLTPTPFYPESGGQTADTGYLEDENGSAKVIEAYYNQYDQIILKVQVKQGLLKKDKLIHARVDQARRQALRRSHTSTHLLHQALRDTFGEHVNQAGSLVEADRLRFDFTHFNLLTEEDLENLEIMVNEKIRENLSVKVYFSTLEEASNKGALALFEGKYAEQVRLLCIGDYSMELCGGTHLEATGEIGYFKLLHEESVGAGVRRLEAITGEEARKQAFIQDKRVKEMASFLKTNAEEVETKLQEWFERYRNLEDGYKELQRKLAKYQAEELIYSAKQNGDVKVISAQVSAENMDALRELADHLKERLERAVVVLGSVKDNKVMLIAAATKELIKEGIHAGNIVKEISGRVGGGGGGRPDMAQAGGKNPDGLPVALKEVEGIVYRQKEKNKS